MDHPIGAQEAKGLQARARRKHQLSCVLLFTAILGVLEPIFACRQRAIIPAIQPGVAATIQGISVSHEYLRLREGTILANIRAAGFRSLLGHTDSSTQHEPATTTVT